MKRNLFFILLNIYIFLPAMASSQIGCPEMITIKLETKQQVSFCKINSLMVSEDCFNQKEACALIKEYASKKKLIVDSKPIKKAAIRNPGSMICNLLGWKVLMGTMFDESQVCICEHPSGSKVICTTMM